MDDAFYFAGKFMAVARTLSVGTGEVGHVGLSRGGKSAIHKQCSVFSTFGWKCHFLFLYLLLGSTGINCTIRTTVQSEKSCKLQLPLIERVLCSGKERQNVVKKSCPREK